MRRSPSVEDGFARYLEDTAAEAARRAGGAAAAPTSIDVQASSSGESASGPRAGSLSGARRASTGSSYRVSQVHGGRDVFPGPTSAFHSSWAASGGSPHRPAPGPAASGAAAAGAAAAAGGVDHWTTPAAIPSVPLAPPPAATLGHEVEGPLAPAELGILADADHLGPLAAAARADALRGAASAAPSAVAPGSRNFSRLRSEFSSNVGPVHHELRRRFREPSPTSFQGHFDEHQGQWRTRSGVQSTRWQPSLPGERQSPDERPLWPAELLPRGPSPQFSLAPSSAAAAAAGDDAERLSTSSAARPPPIGPRRRLFHSQYSPLPEESPSDPFSASATARRQEAAPAALDWTAARLEREQRAASARPDDDSRSGQRPGRTSTSSGPSVAFSYDAPRRRSSTRAESPIGAAAAAAAGGAAAAPRLLRGDVGSTRDANRVRTPSSSSSSDSSSGKGRARRLIRSTFSAPRPPFDGFASPPAARRLASEAGTAASRARESSARPQKYSYAPMNDMGAPVSPVSPPGDGPQELKGARRKYKVFYRQAAPECIGRFQLGDMLGDGAYGKVREAVDTSTGEQVAVKILDLRKLSKLRDTREAIEREISTLKQLNHKNIVKIIDVMEDEKKQKLHIVLELVEGGSLLTRIEDADNGRLSSAEARPYFRKLIRALRYCHSKGVVHLDVKPSNCLTTSTGELKLADFGVSHQLEDPRNDLMDTTWTTTPAFMAPEVATGDNEKVSGFMVDVWAAGVTLYLMVTGQPPFMGLTVYKVYQSIARGTYTLPAYLHPDLQDLIKRMLQRDPAQRPALADVLRHPWVARSEPIPSSVSEYVSKKHVLLQDRLETVVGPEELEEVAVEVSNDPQLAELDVYVEEDQQSVCGDQQEMDNFEGQGEDLPVLRPLDSERLRTCTIL